MGVARIIASHPEGAGYDSLHWQVSTTRISAHCPFSILPGLDRHFLVLEGEGVELNCRRPEGELRSRLWPGSGAFEFRGDWQTECRLLGGPVEVFNVIVRRGRWEARVSQSENQELPEAADETLLAFVDDGLVPRTLSVRLAEIRAGTGQ